MRIPLEHYPGMNTFVLDWLNGDKRFLPRPPFPVAPRAGKTAGSEALSKAIDRSNRHWGIFARESIERWARGETVTIVAGQQVGFAGGPLYTLAKLATIVRMKRDLEANGTPATAFFWLATEDHDFDEAATLDVPVATLSREKNVNRQLDLVRIRAIRGAESRAVVGSLPIPEALITQLLALFDIPRPQWLRAGVTFRDSFAELVASLFGNEVILIDALLPELRRAGEPLFAQILERQDEIQRILANRSAEVAAAGYSPQVVPNEGHEYTLLYELDDNGHRQTPTADRTPENTSTSALTRPLLQDFVLQPDVFVGGPAEVAYYAQITPLHELLGIDVPRVALRAHVLVAPKRVARAFDRYGLDPAKIFAPPDAIVAEQEPESVARIRELAAEGKRELMQRIARIGELALPADHSLAGSIQRSVGHLEYHFEKLAERAIKGVVRKEKERYAAVREVVATLYPDHHVQDRVVSWLAYWCEHGQHLVERVLDELEPDCACFRIVEL